MWLLANTRLRGSCWVNGEETKDALRKDEGKVDMVVEAGGVLGESLIRS